MSRNKDYEIFLAAVKHNCTSLEYSRPVQIVSYNIVISDEMRDTLNHLSDDIYTALVNFFDTNDSNALTQSESDFICMVNKGCALAHIHKSPNFIDEDEYKYIQYNTLLKEIKYRRKESSKVVLDDTENNVREKIREIIDLYIKLQNECITFDRDESYQAKNNTSNAEIKPKLKFVSDEFKTKDIVMAALNYNNVKH